MKTWTLHIALVIAVSAAIWIGFHALRAQAAEQIDGIPAEMQTGLSDSNAVFPYQGTHYHATIHHAVMHGDWGDHSHGVDVQGGDHRVMLVEPDVQCPIGSIQIGEGTRIIRHETFEGGQAEWRVCSDTDHIH